MTSVETSALMKLASKPVLKATLPLFKKLTDGVSHYFNDGILDYLSASIDKYQNMKTLLHRQPTPFYDIYYPTKLEWVGKDIITDSVYELFNQHNCVTIIGDAGSGKSTLVKHLFLSSLLQSYKTPIFVTLRDLNIQKSNLEIYIREEILQNKLSPSDNYLNKLLEGGEFLFILDGYDEIKSSEKQEITKTLETFIDKYPKNNYILTSRPYSNIEYFKSFYNYFIKDLEIGDQIEFTKKQIEDGALADKIITSITEGTQGYINSFFKNPLLLTLYILTYSNNSSIPTSKHVFYRRVFDVLFEQHDSTSKIGFERERKTQLNQESFEKILQAFSIKSFFAHKFDFDKDYIYKLLEESKKDKFTFNNNDFIDDMKSAIGLWTEDCGTYTFSHRSLQEYFTAVYISKISNITNKTAIYAKMIQSLEDLDFDIKNLLSLCYEIDKDYFTENFMLPVLEKIKNLLVLENHTFNYNLPYFSGGLFFDKKEFNGYAATKDLCLLINSEKFLGIDLFRLLCKPLGSIIHEHMHHEKFLQYINISKSNIPEENEKEEFELKLPVEITNDYIHFLQEIGVDSILRNAIEKVEEIKQKLEKDIELSKNLENDFISTI